MSSRPRVERSYQRGPHLYRRGATWYARGGALPRGGTSLHTSDRTEAERRFRELLTRGDRGKVGPDAARSERTLDDCVAEWLKAPHGYTRRTKVTHNARVAAVGKWLALHGVTRPADITPALLDDWTTARSAKVSRVAINRDLRALKVCLRWCAARGLCEPVTALDRPGLREPKREPHRLLPDPVELSRVLLAIPQAGYRDALVCYLATGMRFEELQRLTVGDVRDGRVYVQPEAGPADTAEPGKAYRTRAIPIAPEVRAVIVRHLAWRVPGKRGRTASADALREAVDKACVATKVPRFVLHDLRRCFATEAVRRGTPLTVVRDWLGHRLTSTTERYIGRYRSDADVTAPLPAILAGTGAASLLNPGAGISTTGRRLSIAR